MPDDILPVGQQPEAPTKPSVSIDALNNYFQSVEEPFRETRLGLAKESDGLNGGFIAFFILSLIPVIPYAASKLSWWFFPSNFISIWGIHFHLASFWFWWLTIFIVSLAALILAGELSGVSADEKKKWLSPPQMRFAYCYAVVDEIRNYKTNQLQRHIDTALEYLDKTGKSLLPRIAFPIGSYPDEYWARQIRFPQEEGMGLNDVAIGPPKWYRLRPETELILKAFGEFHLKLRDRLKDRKDLPTIETALTFLASYQYLEIPELSDSKSEARFEEGIQSLVNFAQQVTSLAPYRSEQLKVTPKENLSRKFVALVSKVTAPFSHENALIAFFFWLVFLFVLFSSGFAMGLRYFALKMDSTIITTLIGGPILGAITAVTIPRMGRQKKDRD